MDDDVQSDELADLQRRLYGREAEGVRDSGAEARLRALTESSAEVASAAQPIPSRFSTMATEASFVPDQDRVDPSPAAPRARLRRTAVLWIASVVLAVAATAGVAALLDGGRGREVAVLSLAQDESGEGRGFGDGAASEDWYGLTLVRSSTGEPGEEASFCLVALPTDSENRALFASGCSAATFPAVLQITVSEDMPAELREAFPDGSGLQFTLDGNAVKVRSDAQ